MSFMDQSRHTPSITSASSVGCGSEEETGDFTLVQKDMIYRLVATEFESRSL